MCVIEGAKLRYGLKTRPDRQSWLLLASTVTRALFAIAVLAASIALIRTQATAQERAKSPAATKLDPLRSDQVTQARKILLEARTIAESSDNKDKDRVPWESIALASARSGDAEGAARALVAIEHVLRSHRADNTPVPMPRFAMDIHAETAFELSRLGMQSEAFKLIDLAPTTADKWFALQNLVEAQARAGDIKLAQKTLGYMLEAQSMLSDRAAVIERSKRNIAIAQAESGDVEGTSRTATQIQDPVMKMQAQCALAMAQAAKGNREAALTTLAEVDKEIPLFVEKFGEAQLFSIQEMVLAARVRVDPASALKAAEKLPDQERQENKLVIAAEFAHRGDVSAAMKILESDSDFLMSHPNNAEPVILEMATQRSAAADKAGALELCDFALRIMGRIEENSFIKTRDLPQIAVIQAQAGDSARATRTLTQVKEIVSKSKESSGYLGLARMQARLGDFEEARKTISLLKCSAVVRDDGVCEYSKLHAELELANVTAVAQAHAKQFDEARKTISLFECPSGNLRQGCLQTRERMLTQLVRISASLGDATNTLAWARRQDLAVVNLDALINVALGLLDQVNPSANPGQYMSTPDTMDWP